MSYIFSNLRSSAYGAGGLGGCNAPSRENNSNIRAKVMSRSGKDTVNNLLFNILISLFSSRNSPNLLTDLCTTSQGGCYNAKNQHRNRGYAIYLQRCQGASNQTITPIGLYWWDACCSERQLTTEGKRPLSYHSLFYTCKYWQSRRWTLIKVWGQWPGGLCALGEIVFSCSPSKF